MRIQSARLLRFTERIGSDIAALSRYAKDRNVRQQMRDWPKVLKQNHVAAGFAPKLYVAHCKWTERPILDWRDLTVEQRQWWIREASIVLAGVTK